LTTCAGRGLVLRVKGHLLAIAVVGLVAMIPLGIVAVGSASAEQPVGRAGAERVLAEIGRDSGLDAAIVRGPAEHAKKALERANGARSAGDVRHAEQLEALACEWALVARDMVRTGLAEADAAAVELQLGDATVRAERARALLEEAIARRGRALAELENLDAGPASANPAKTKTKGPPGAKPAPAGSAGRERTYGGPP
jgi:hypothetical protein